MFIVPIGSNCVVAYFLRGVNLRKLSLPFDWMFSYPNFIREMLRLLLEENMDERELVTKHFFLHDKRSWRRGEYNISVVPGGNNLLNSKYDVVFPHDTISQETIDKYTRRFIRLKEIIKNEKEKVVFVYSSQNTLLDGIYRIDDKIILKDVYQQMNNLVSLLDKHCANYEVIFFDAILNEDRTILNEKIKLIPLEEKPTWPALLPEMKKHMHLFSE